jgi:DNA-binding transcriptional regulator YiaG
MNPAMCPGCGSRAVAERELTEYRYAECGLPGVKLHGGVLETRCRACGERFVSIQSEGQLLQAIALMLLTGPNRLTGPELRFIRRTCELSQDALARSLRCRRATVAEREAMGQPRISEAEQIWIRLVLLDEFRKHLEGPDRNFLSSSHMDRLQTFGKEFSLKALAIAGHALKRHTKELWMRPDHTWETSEAA